MCAAAVSRCVMWRRAALEYILVKEPNLAQALSALIANDIALKLVGMSSNLRSVNFTRNELLVSSISTILSGDLVEMAGQRRQR